MNDSDYAQVPDEVLLEASEQAQAYMEPRFKVFPPQWIDVLTELFCDMWLQGKDGIRRTETYLSMANAWLCSRVIPYDEQIFPDLAELFELFYELGKGDS